MQKRQVRQHTHFVVLTFQFQKEEDNRWTAECMELGTATYADNLDQAHKELVELVELHLNSLEEVNERERFFQEHNIQMYTIEPKSTTTIQAPTDPRVFSQPYVTQLVEAG